MFHGCLKGTDSWKWLIQPKAFLSLLKWKCLSFSRQMRVPAKNKINKTFTSSRQDWSFLLVGIKHPFTSKVTKYKWALIYGETTVPLRCLLYTSTWTLSAGLGRTSTIVRIYHTYVLPTYRYLLSKACLLYTSRCV